MLFKQKFWPGLRSGAITLTFRRWSSPRVKVGGRYRCGRIGLLEVDSIDAVRVRDIKPAEAKRSGFPDRAALLAELATGGKRPLRAGDRVYRVELHFAGPDERPRPDTGAALSESDARALCAKLDRMDRLSRHGPWTRATLRLIGKQSRVPAARLAEKLGRERPSFKADVRKLKKLGLTISHEVGYELSPRGRTLLDRC